MLNHFEQRTQIPKAYAVIGTLSLAVILHAFNPLAAPVSNLVGWGIPAYLSFKAIESPSPHDDVQWLTYWVVFGFMNFLESFALRLVLYYVPWYFAFKSAFIVWLQLPAFRVSHRLSLISLLERPSQREATPLLSMFSSTCDIMLSAWCTRLGRVPACFIRNAFINTILFQGAQTIYFSVLKPVLQNASSSHSRVVPVTATSTSDHSD